MSANEASAPQNQGSASSYHAPTENSVSSQSNKWDSRQQLCRHEFVQRETMVNALAAYDSLVPQMSIATSTASNYKSRIKLYVDFIREFIDSNVLVSSFSSSSVILKYVDYLRNERFCTNGTVNSFLAAHRHFSQTLQLDLPPYPREYPPSSTFKRSSVDTDRLKRSLRMLPIREQCVIALLLFTDLRSEEIRALRMNDIFVSLNQLFILTCRNRMVSSAAPELMQPVLDWFEYRHVDHCAQSCHPFLINRTGSPLSSVAIHWTVRKWGWKLNLPLNARRLSSSGASD